MSILKYIPVEFSCKLCCFTGLLVVVCLSGDFIAYQSGHLKIPLVMRLLGDTITHNLVAMLSWLIVIHPSPDYHEPVICGILASLIDIDHFVMARSFMLSDAIKLEHRPPLHNSGLLIIISAGLFGIKVFSDRFSNQPIWLFIIAWVSHHLRDGYRRGLWIGPVSTPPFSQWIYIVAVLAIPMFLRVFFKAKKSASILSTLDV